MKKLIIVLSLVMGLAGVSKGQDLINWDEIEYGIKGGINYTNLGNDYDANIGYELGCFAFYKLDNKLTLNVSTLYTTAGATKSQKILGTTYKTEVNTKYLKVPAILSYKVSPEAQVFGGGYLGYKLSGSGSVRKLDYGLVIGGSYIFEQIVIDCSYSLGLLDVSGDQKAGVQNSAITIALNYKLDL